jgi:hypothetical protein
VYCRIIQEHERRMEATVDEAERALHTLDYPLHLLRSSAKAAVASQAFDTGILRRRFPEEPA